MRDAIVNELVAETRARIAQWQTEREQLQKAAGRIAELDQMIDGAEAELESLFIRKPQLRPAPVKAEVETAKK